MVQSFDLVTAGRRLRLERDPVGLVSAAGGLVLRWGQGSLSLLCTECKSSNKANDALVVDAWSGRTWSAGVPVDVVHAAAVDHTGRRH